jgi:hypothetical protein
VGTAEGFTHLIEDGDTIEDRLVMIKALYLVTKVISESNERKKSGKKRGGPSQTQNEINTLYKNLLVIESEILEKEATYIKYNRSERKKKQIKGEISELKDELTRNAEDLEKSIENYKYENDGEHPIICNFDCEYTELPNVGRNERDGRRGSMVNVVNMPDENIRDSLSSLQSSSVGVGKSSSHMSNFGELSYQSPVRTKRKPVSPGAPDKRKSSKERSKGISVEGTNIFGDNNESRFPPVNNQTQKKETKQKRTTKRKKSVSPGEPDKRKSSKERSKRISVEGTNIFGDNNESRFPPVNNQTQKK